MEASGVGRLVAVSAVPVGPVPDGESFVNRRILLPFIGAFARDVYVDLAEMEDEIRRSATQWTIVRPPKLVNKPLTGTVPHRRGRQRAARLLDFPRRRGPPHARRPGRPRHPQPADRDRVLIVSGPQQIESSAADHLGSPDP